MNLLEWIEGMFREYGYFVLLLGLPVDFIALPLPPGQTTLTYSGYLAFKGILDLLPVILAAFAGSCIGITITYLIGHHVGAPLIQRFGKWLFLKPSYIEKTRRIYDKYGNRMLLISFFVPGVRQFFGYFVGIIRIPFRTFALYAYPGALIWVVAFVGIGYIFGDQWQAVIGIVENYLVYIFSLLGVIVFAILYVRWRKWRKWRLKQPKPNKELG
ncbi:DedA family protein [Paenibacillus sp. DYY-L-2]|uniref:DedA family protein n=1 Tax=Paenibacillus sp. DYY-L-2 TaxID=3447013 RepID=UPI003F5070FC